MSFSPEYRSLVEAKISTVVPIRTKAMFGGVGIYSGDLFFALIAEDKLFFKVDDTNRPDFEQAGMEPFYPYGSPTPMHYWEVPNGVFNDSKQLKLWVEKAIAVAARKKRR
ncbi:MAG: TfoX/Sxy family protein [Fimbriimonadales bacterium]|nr:TfoX/Sxy family protein [Fimbriimonadales bacterium]